MGIYRSRDFDIITDRDGMHGDSVTVIGVEYRKVNKNNYLDLISKMRIIAKQNNLPEKFENMLAGIVELERWFDED